MQSQRLRDGFEWLRTIISRGRFLLGATMNQVCIRCHESKPLSEYYAHPGTTLRVLGKCKECCKAYQKERRITHPEGMKAIDRKKYMKRRVAHMAKSSEYQKWYFSLPANREKRSEYGQKRRARLYDNGHVPYSRLAVFSKYPACLACWSTSHLSIDHVVPVSLGGPDKIENLQVLCRSCNSSKHATYHEYRPTYLLHSGA